VSTDIHKLESVSTGPAAVEKPEVVSTAAVDPRDFTLADIVRGLKRVKLAAAIWLSGGLIFALTSVYSAGAHWGGQPSQQTTVSNGGYASGITSVTDKMSNEELKAFLLRAHFRVRVIVPWFVDPLTVKEALTGILGNDQATVQVYFLDPKSPHLKERGRVARPELTNYGPNEMLRSLSVVAPLFAKARASAKLLTYDSIPAAFIAQVDDQALIGFHMHTGVAIHNPILFFDVSRKDMPTAMGRMIDEEFAALAPLAKEIEASSVVSDNSGAVTFDYKGLPN
jgi:hypothetical protein